METIRKSRKIYKCYICSGNIQKGEKYMHAQYKVPNYEDEINPDLQTGIWYENVRLHARDCEPKLLYFDNTKKILKNCNFDKHSPVWDTDPDDIDGLIWCEWCGVKLISVENPVKLISNS